MLGKRIEKHYKCNKCGFTFTNLEVSRVCNNCFACTGCEIYVCPSCGQEVVIKAVKKAQVNGLKK